MTMLGSVWSYGVWFDTLWADGVWGQAHAPVPTGFWSYITSGANESWALATHAATTWNDNTRSNTTTRNTSRFVLLHPSVGSVRGGVDFGVHLRSLDEKGRGASFRITTNDPVRLHTSGDSSI